MSGKDVPTPLYKKLGITNGSEILILNQPKKYITFFSEFPSKVLVTTKGESKQLEFIHIFVKTIIELEHFYRLAKTRLKKNGILWISWPKKASKITSELNKFTIMKYGLDNGLVDTKEASIDQNWSGHKFVYRLKDR